MNEADRLLLPYRPNVGLMIVNPQGRIFAGRRIDYPDAWQMPQGGIDEGEDPLQAAYRELYEETGIVRDAVNLLAESRDWHTYDFPPEVAGKLWKGGYRGQKQRWYLMGFEGDDAQINIATEHPEFDVWRWMEPPELIERIVPFKRDIYRAVMREFSGRLR